MDTVAEKTEHVLDYIKKYSDKNGYCPSIREICIALNIKSTATCHYYLNKLEKSGEIIKAGTKKRALSVKRAERADYITVPLIGTVTAGMPIFAYENFESFYPIPPEFGNEQDLFMLKINGTSMIDAGIFDGDKVIVKKQNVAENGDIVVAMIEDSATVKRFYKKNDKIILHPEHETMCDIVLDDVTILGVVEGLLRKF